MIFLIFFLVSFAFSLTFNWHTQAMATHVHNRSNDRRREGAIPDLGHDVTSGTALRCRFLMKVIEASALAARHSDRLCWR